MPHHQQPQQPVDTYVINAHPTYTYDPNVSNGGSMSIGGQSFTNSKSMDVTPHMSLNVTGPANMTSFFGSSQMLNLQGVQQYPIPISVILVPNNLLG
mmetsp:Transcript_23073/g.35721  ORF Transcript_23073/g.35721 Transcript_23073/m.35721 type:complete len:97 (+) Transcript_23073:45-335(+)|eukprot:CAMPEP_0170490466 /NCGR_PEP_ID=MMETSP0208-20121228/8641_1 /TAXON_ID=197538 /ORGANISM="Strombidium inclinatum, Strain S3" /LENGTH=96 /DNA_ID=CAMNT_0010765841 /DNA_START=62 /DNA_END=352 /DNA_ORIENTATION=+